MKELKQQEVIRYIVSRFLPTGRRASVDSPGDSKVYDPVTEHCSRPPVIIIEQSRMEESTNYIETAVQLCVLPLVIVVVKGT